MSLTPSRLFLSPRFTEAEWRARVQLAACYRIFAHLHEGQRILQSSGGKFVLLLRNHGPVVMGQSLAQAFNLMWLVQRACEVQVASQALGPLRAIAPAVLEKCVRDSLNFKSASADAGFEAPPHAAWPLPGQTLAAGEDSCAAMQRLIDRLDPRYRA